MCENCGKEIGKHSWIGGAKQSHFITEELGEIHFCPFCGYGLIKQKGDGYYTSFQRCDWCHDIILRKAVPMDVLMPAGRVSLICEKCLSWDKNGNIKINILNTIWGKL